MNSDLIPSLEDSVLNILEGASGLKAKHIADNLGIERRQVNSLLHGKLRERVYQDKSYRWWLRGSQPKQQVRSETESKDTPLAQLCRYYLDCLSHDDLGGVSDFASSKYGNLNYAELELLPMFDETGRDPFDSEDGRRLLSQIRRDRNRQTVFLGYPVRLNLIRSRKGWEGFLVEPLLLFPFQGADSKYDTPTLTDDLPQINFKALGSLSNAHKSSLMNEAIQLAEELGLASAVDDQPDLDELLVRMREIRPDWDWQEEIDPYTLSNGPPLCDLNQQGIFNRAILISAERSYYTKGLESELGMLQNVEKSKYERTALGAWLSGQTFESPPADQQPLLEVVPLNSEQRQAVRQALSNPLTVITGPPGTGKSQVVTSILVNAAWQGKTVLFASKNNKAVNVVETRVNALGPRPVLLRLGANEYQSRLAEYLVSLLAATTTPDDHERYKECHDIHNQLQRHSENLDTELQRLVDLRNEVDHLEQRAERIRWDLGEGLFHRFGTIEYERLEQDTKQLQAAIDQADRTKQPFLTKLVWPFVCKRRFDRLADEGAAFIQNSQQLELSAPEAMPNSANIDQWVQYGSQLDDRILKARTVQQYFQKLASLTGARSFEELSKQRKKLTKELTANSEALWQAWLQLQPSRLSHEQRKLLGDYSSLLQMIVFANNENRLLGRNVFRRYYQLFPKITSILSCWAVTSLSARSRVPFEPDFFDILVIDEASQCDIASALPLLYRARQVVIIGDPMQLRHISTLSKLQDQQLLSRHGLIHVFLSWAYSTRSLFDLASSFCKSEDIIALRDHHRSHADIVEFSNNTFYEGRLRIATNYDRLNRPWNDKPAVRWVDVRGKVVRPSTGGALNEQEAHAVVDEIERLVSQGYKGSIGVVSPFRAQANRIRDIVFQRDSLTRGLANADFLSDAIHSFQGDERDVMIFSPTLSEGTHRGALWFLKNYPNLFNVAITRARAALIVVGDKASALNCGVDHLVQFATYTDKVGYQQQDAEPPEAFNLGSEYPSVSHPERVSDWERFFYRVLYQAGIRPIPQYPVEKYVLDFALIAGDRQLNIEIDGERYHRNWDGELCRRDQIRNQRLMELGWDVMRFWVYQIRDDLDSCISRVQKWIKQ